jgi:hypothetical protein
MEQVVIFQGYDPNELEEQINCWLQKNKEVEIVQRSVGAGTDGGFLSFSTEITIVLFYKAQ